MYYTSDSVLKKLFVFSINFVILFIVFIHTVCQTCIHYLVGPSAIFFIALTKMPVDNVRWFITITAVFTCFFCFLNTL